MTQDHAVADAPNSLAGWLAALSAFIAGFVAFGVMYSFGVFFIPMEAEFHSSRTATSAFFAITGMLFYFSGSVTGRLSDRFGPRRIVLTGAIVMGCRTGTHRRSTADVGWLFDLWCRCRHRGVLRLHPDAGACWWMVHPPSHNGPGPGRSRHRMWNATDAAHGRGADTRYMVGGQPTHWFAAGSLCCFWLAPGLRVSHPLNRAIQVTELRHVVRLREQFVLLYMYLGAGPRQALSRSMVFLPPV